MQNKRNYLITAVIFVLFNLIAFVIPGDKTTVFWISYVFTVFSFGIFLFIWNKTLGSGKQLKSKFLSIPIFYVSSCYFIVQFVSFLIFKFALTNIPVWAAILVNTFILGISLIFLIVADGSKEYIESVDKKVQDKILWIKEAQTDVDILISEATDSEVKDALRELSKVIRYSDPMSDSSLVELESQISEKIGSLDIFDKEKTLTDISQIKQLIEARNKKCLIRK